MELMHDPPHPGVMIRELWMGGLSVEAAADRLRVNPEDLQRLLDGRCGISPSMALKMADAGWSNAPYWMRIQAYYDLAQERLRQERAA